MKSMISAFCLLLMALPATAALEAGLSYDDDMVVECASFNEELITYLRVNKVPNKAGKYDVSLVREAGQLSKSPLRTSKLFPEFSCSFSGKKNGEDFNVSCSRNETYGDNVTTNLTLNGNTMILRTSGMHDDTTHALMKEASCDMNMENLRKLLK